MAEADLAAAQAALDLAELDLEYTEIRAPFDGRFGKRMVSVGALVGPNSGPLGTLVTQSPMYVTFSLSEPQFVSVLQQLETDVEGLHDHERSPNVFFSLPNGTDLEETGKIVFLDNRINPATGTIALRAEVPNARRLILDGGFVTVRIEALEPTPSVLVPHHLALL